MKIKIEIIFIILHVGKLNYIIEQKVQSLLIDDGEPGLHVLPFSFRGMVQYNYECMSNGDENNST